jgi:hypothetical protein
LRWGCWWLPSSPGDNRSVFPIADPLIRGTKEVISMRRFSAAASTVILVVFTALGGAKKFYLILVCLIGLASPASAQWQPAQGPLMTRWAKQVSPDNVHGEYPRPQMTREKWTNLNGLWDYAIRPNVEVRPENFDGQILVPFPVESALSGVMKPVGADDWLWYRRTFERPQLIGGRRLLLHFGAVDWSAMVFVNRQVVGRHQGGYDAFTFDITDALTGAGMQEIDVCVMDPTDKSFQPRGKQVAKPRGIWYTSVTGIWQTVWLEAVPAAHVERLKITPDIDNGMVKLSVELNAAAPLERTELLRVEIRDGEELVAEWEATAPLGRVAEIELPMGDAKLWSPDSPFLYSLKVALKGDDNDAVSSYFGMRKIEVKRDSDGFNRLFLNGKPLFQYGPLDQGWWPDGLYTAPTDDALRYDIEMTKRLGMNMCRKHVKVEPARWYYWCDKLGLLVWQDMPSGDRFIKPDEPDIQRSPESAVNFYREYQALIDTHYNHPCIVVWVPFNEGWGQFDTKHILAWTKQHDPTRLVDGPSGWSDRGTGDMYDMHRYPGPAMPAPQERRAAVLGEFGGLGLPMQGHLWWDKRNWGYRTYATRDELQTNYDQLLKQLRPLIGQGLAAAIYTQTTDVEGEVNGLMTYDRAVVKLDVEKVAAAHRKFYLPPPIIITKTIVPTSEAAGQTWRYTTAKPAEGWESAAFEDSKWNVGQGGFGEKTTPGTVVRTDWKTPDIWLRRAFEWKDTGLANPQLRIHHDEDAEVYLNGRRIASLTGYVTGYIEVELVDEARATLRAGTNTLAVHCHQKTGGQYIDVGLVDVIERERGTASP